MAQSISTVFDKLNETFSAQDAIREALKRARDKADASVRIAQRALSTLHTTKDLQAQAANVCDLLKVTGEPLKAIEHALPKFNGAFHRYADIWHPQLQLASMVAVVLDFLMNGTLANVDKVKEMVSADIQLPIEDYLMGVCNAVSELARLSLNRVIRNDFETPGKCHEFATNVFEGFKELNLRNDFLRKRYDGMKYDVKKMEDILYDLSIRGLLNGKKRKSPPEDAASKKMKTHGEAKTDSETDAGRETKSDGETKPAARTRSNDETKSDGKPSANDEMNTDGKPDADGETKAVGKPSREDEIPTGKGSKDSPMDTTS